MNVFRSKFSIVLIIHFTLLVLLIDRFNQRFLMFEYGYEPLFVLNLIILVCGILTKVVIDKKINITFYEILVYSLTIWLVISLLVNLTEHSLNGVNIGRILNIIIPMLFVTLIYLWKDKITKDNIINILGFMVVIAAVIGLTAFISLLFPEFMVSLFNWDLEGISRGTISPINNGTFLALFIIPSITLFIYYDDKKNIRLLFLLCFVFILLGLIATGRRGSYFPAIIFIIIFFTIILYKNFSKKGLKKYFKYIVIIVSFFIIFTINLLNSGEVGRLFGQVDTQKDNIGRIIRMGPAIDSILEKPFVGDGIGNYYYRLNERHISEVESVTYNSWIQLSDPHNTYIMITGESGIIGLLIFLFILLYVYIRLKPYDLISLGIFLGISVFLINCLVDTRLWKGLVRIDTVFWMFVGIGIIYNEKIRYLRRKE